MPQSPPSRVQTLKTRFRRFWALTPADRRLLVQAACILVAVKLALRCLPLRLTQRALGYLGHKPPGTPPGVQERIIWAVSTASGLVPGGGNCLARALTLQTLLARCGVVTEVRIGFARADSGAVEGHAWLTHEGRVIMGDLADLGRFENAPVGTPGVGR
jgi:hypothetical protein